jgi:hypothetical protein
MRSTLKAALLAALPIEIVNFWVVGYPADTHTVSAASHYASVALQWYLVHLPGIIASDRILLLREHSVVCSFVLLVVGYVDTTIVLIAILWAARLALNTLRKLSSPMKHAH